jgi:tRNA(Ile)-lysidine synthase
MPKKSLARKLATAEKLSKHTVAEFSLKLLRRLQENHWARAGQRIGVAVSGGADSVALLLLLLELREKLGIVLSVVHFNHKLRGRASDADEKFVAELAKRHGLLFHAGSEDISAKSKRERANLEDAARRARYGFFERLATEGKVDRVAVAHTADDQAETVLAHIFRGTGLSGLGGIHPEVVGVFRPLLPFRRGELRDYLRSRRQRWREDLTNRDTKRTRARIRLKIMPVLEKQFAPAVVEHLCRLAELARADDGWLTFSAHVRVSALAKQAGKEVRIKVTDLLGPWNSEEQIAAEDEFLKELRKNRFAMTSRMIRRMVVMVKQGCGQLSSVHVDAVLRLALQPDSGKSLPLPGGVEVRREREALVFRAMTDQRPDKSMAKGLSKRKEFSHIVKLGSQPANVALVEPPCCLRFTVIDWPPQGRETSVTGAVLDRDRICLPLVVRNWQPGDRMQPLGHQKPHKLSRLLNELGVSRWKKEMWPVVASGERIAWTRGLAVSAEFAPDTSTRKGVVITEVPSS